MLLPLQFNDGRAVPDELIAVLLTELEDQFGAVSAETQPISGRWRHGGKSYRDNLMRVYVDVVDEDATREFFVRLKERLKAELQQIDIWMTTYPIDVL